MKLAPTLLVSLLGACAFLSGCATPDKVSGITVSLAGFRPADAALRETRPIMTLRFTSEDVSAVAISGSSHKIYLNGKYAGKATVDTPLGLTALGTAIQEVPIDLENPALVKQAMAVPGQPLARYRVESVLHIADSEEKFQIKTSFEGSISLRGLEAAAR